MQFRVKVKVKTCILGEETKDRNAKSQNKRKRENNLTVSNNVHHAMLPIGRTADVRDRYLPL